MFHFSHNTVQLLTETLVTDILKEKLDLDPIPIDRAHRVGKAKASKPRSIVVKLSAYKDKERVMKTAKDKKLRNVFINEDFSARVLAKRLDLLPEMRRARNSGKIAYLSFDKLIVKDKPAVESTSGESHENP